jgi:hypothetical protein
MAAFVAAFVNGAAADDLTGTDDADPSASPPE